MHLAASSVSFFKSKYTLDWQSPEAPEMSRSLERFLVPLRSIHISGSPAVRFLL